MRVRQGTPLRRLDAAREHAEFVQFVMLAAPTTHFVMLAQGILFRAAGLDIAWPQFLALAAIGATFFSVANARFRSTIGMMA